MGDNTDHVLRHRKDSNKEIMYITNWKQEKNNHWGSTNSLSILFVAKSNLEIRKHLKGRRGGSEEWMSPVIHKYWKEKKETHILNFKTSELYWEQDKSSVIEQQPPFGDFK